MQLLELIVVSVGTTAIFWQVRQSRKNIELAKNSKEDLIKLETIKYIDSKFRVISAGADWTKENKTLLENDMEKLRNKTPSEDYNLILDKESEYLTPLFSLYNGLSHGVFNLEIIKTYSPTITGMVSRFKNYIDFRRNLQEKAGEKADAYDEVIELCKLLS